MPRQRQTLLFSATLPPAIRTLADQWLTDPVDVRVTPATVTVEAIRQSVFFVDQKQKLQLLTHWLRETPWTRTLVFTRTKHGADKVAKSLVKAGIPGRRLPQQQEPIGPAARACSRFKAPQPLVLVATDIAARGLDIDDVSHVVNFDLPVDVENYIHRIGRTGRAGAAGVAVSFCDHGRAGDLAGHSTSDAADARRGGASGGHGPNRVAASEAFRREDQQRSGGSPGVHQKSPSTAARQPSSRGLAGRK